LLRWLQLVLVLFPRLDGAFDEAFEIVGMALGVGAEVILVDCFFPELASGVPEVVFSLGADILHQPLGGTEGVGATIHWGDGTTSAGSIVYTNGNHFAVQGSHAYVEEGYYAVSTSITHNNLPAVLATTTASVADAPLTALAGAGTTLSALEGSALTTATVATFTDPGLTFFGGSPPLGDYSASIDWGDGWSSAGTIVSLVGNIPSPMENRPVR
jgi:hypothetical protein